MAFIALLISVFIITGTDLFVTQYLQLVHGLRPLIAGLWLVPGAIALIVGSMAAPGAARRFGPGRVVGAGMALSSVGLVVYALLQPGSSVGVVVVGSAVVGLGVGPVGALGTDLLVTAAPADRAASAGALSETGTEMGGALGIALLGALGTTVYRGMLKIPAGVGLGAATSSRNTLGGAFHAARSLDHQLAARLVRAARISFTQGLVVVAIAAAMIAIATAALAAVRLRSVEPT